jgi:secreted trypsin-like serine protease
MATNRETGTWIGIAKVLVHAGYNEDAHENDLALLKLDGPLAGEVIPLAQPGVQFRMCERLEVISWARTKERAPLALISQSTEVPFIDGTTCNAANAYKGAIKTSMMCAGYRDGRFDDCYGDSGGPLVWRARNGPVLVGILSWGDGCAQRLRYGVYTRIDAYSDWIAGTILANQD